MALGAQIDGRTKPNRGPRYCGRLVRRLVLLVLLCILGLGAALIVGGCAAGTTTTTPASTQTTQPPPQTTATTTPETTSTTAAQTTTTSTSAPSTSTSTTVASDNAQLIRQTRLLAQQGKVIAIPFVCGTGDIGQVEQAWGTATTQDYAGAATYFTYASRRAAFGINKGDQIIDIRSSSPQLQVVTQSQVTSTLGSPGILRHLPGQSILLYPAGPDYQLLWIFPTPTSARPDPHLDHVSVFYPAGTVNLMAQNVPNPSILLKQPPGSSGSLFTFSIQDSPAGYTLAELEWIPASGPAVITTLPQAISYGASGGSGSYFAVKADGQTWSFIYTSARKGQSGIVKLIYQNSDGAAIIGQSDPITLK